MIRMVAFASALILLLLDFNSAWGQKQSTATRHSAQQRTCEPVGRVLSAGDRTLKLGSLLCIGDQLQPINKGTVVILCYLNQKILQLKQGSISDAPNKCVPLPTQAARCTPFASNNCPKPKGPGEDRNTPVLISPYSSAILDPRPSLSWFSVNGATSYTVQVKGKGVNWSSETKSTLLPYPHQELDLESGNVYKVTVIANQGNSPLVASSAVLIVSSDMEAQQVKAMIKRIQNLNLPQDDLAIDIDTVYMSQNLLSEAIKALEVRVRAGTKNPTLYRLLGDRYLEAGLPDIAKREYTTATTLAQKVDNAAELAKARAGLKRTELDSQLPNS